MSDDCAEERQLPIESGISADDGRRDSTAEEPKRDHLSLLERALNFLPLGITIKDEYGKIVYTNFTEASLHGYDVEDMLNREARMLAPKELWKPMDIGEMSHKEAWRRESLNVRKEGGTFPVQLSSNVIRNEKGEALGIVTACEDISVRKKLERELVESRLEIERKIKELEGQNILARSIAHDFNNILSALVGNISIVRHHLGEDDRLLARLDLMEKAAFQARHLSHQLISLADATPALRVMSVVELISEVSGFIASGCEIEHELILPDNIWPIEADEGQMMQVFNNLLMNACQAMPVGGKIRIRVENTLVEAGKGIPLKTGRYVRIAVSDGGHGIAEENLGKIFDHFYTTRQSGSGLGLAITQTIVENHKGHISVKSDVGKGTTFYIYLPAARYFQSG